MQDPSIGIPHWSYIRRGNTLPISVDPVRLNMSKINQSFRKQERIKELQKYDCIIQDFEEFKKLAKKDYVTFFVSFFSNLVSNPHIRSNIKQLFKKFNEKNGPESFLAHLQQNFSPISSESEIDTNILNIQVPNIPNMNNKQPDRNSSIFTNYDYEPQNRNSYLYTKTSNTDLYVQVSPIPEDKQTAFYKLFLFYGLNSAPFKSSFFVNFDPNENPDKIILYNIEKTSSLSQKLIASSGAKTSQVKERILKFMKYLLELIYILHSHGIIIGNLNCSNIRYFYKKPEIYTFLIDSFSDSSYFAYSSNEKSQFIEFNKKLLESFRIIANILIDKIYNPT
jgi:hypothetical protein